MQYQLTKIKRFLRPAILLFTVVFFNTYSTFATTYTWTGTTSSAWATTTNWSPNGNPGSASGDVVNIPAVTNQPVLTVTPANAIASLTFTGTAATLTITSVTLTVSGAVTLNNAAAANVAATITGSGTLSCASVTLGSGVLPTTAATTRTVIMTSTISAFTISGSLTLNSIIGSSNNRISNSTFTHTSGTVTIDGSLTTVNGNAVNTSTYTMGNTSPTLVLGGVTPFSISGTGTNTITLNGTGSTVNYSCSGAQTIYASNYINLTLSGSGIKTLQTATTTISGNLALNGTASVTTVVGLTISGNLSIGDGTTFTAAAFALTVTGTTTVGAGASGTLTISSATGTKAFNGNITVNSGATWNNTAGNASLTLPGSISNSGTFNAGTGLYTLSGTTKTISGTISIPSVTVSGSYTNNGTLTINTVLSATGGLTNGSSGILNIGGTISGTLTASASGNTVNYTGTAQTALVITYDNLILSGSGAKTFATTPTVNNVLSMEGTASITVTTGVVTYGTNGTLQYNKGASYTATSEEWISPFVATGGIIIKNSGAITTPGAVQIGNNTNVPLNINSSATLTPGANLLTLHGDFINNGTLTSGSGGITISGTTATQSISGFTTTGNVSMTKTSGTATITGAVSAANLSVNGTGGILELSGSNTFSGTITITAGTLALSNTAALGASGKAVALNGGILDLTTSSSINAYNITVGGTSTISSDVNSSGAGITHTLGTLSIGAYNLTINAGSNVSSGTSGINFGAVTHTGAPTYTITNPSVGLTQLSLAAVSNSTFLTSFTGNGNVIQTGVFGNGSGGITYSGTGSLSLNQANTFTGTLTISNGTVIGTSNAAALGAGSLTLSGGTLKLTNTAGTALSFNRNTTVSANSQITVDVNASGAGNIYTLGTLSINASTLTIAGGSNVASGIAGVTFGAVTHTGAPTYTITKPSAGTTQLSLAAVSNSTFLSTFNGNGNVIQTGVFGNGSGGITYSGTGSLTLNQANTFTGTLTISNGTVIGTSNAAALGAGSLTLSGGTLKLTNTAGTVLSFNRNTTVSANSQITTDVNASGAGNIYTLGTLSINASTLTIAGGSNVASGTAGITFGAVTHTGAPTYNITNPSAGVTQLSLAAVSNSTFLSTFNGNGNVIQTGVFGNGSGGITYGGTGSLTLNQANTFTGGVTLNSGTLNINNASALGTIAGTFTIAGGTINASNGAINTVNYPLALNGDFTFTGTSNLNLGTGTTTLNASRQITVSANKLTVGGTISSAANSLTKAGSGNFSFGSNAVTLNGLTISAGTLTSTSGTLSLAGSFSNSGTFTHNSGTLTLNGTAQSITGATTFYNLTLGGSGTKTFANATAISNDLSIGSGVVVSLGTLTTHTAGTLHLNGSGSTNGTWGSTSSTATNTNNTYFAATTGYITVSTNSCVSGTWTGFTSTDWNTASNWCDGVVPTSSTNVTISSATNQPVIGATASCNNITINSGATLTNNSNLNIAGNLSGTGTLTNGATGTLNLTGTSTITTLTANAAGNTVNYNGTAQTVFSTNYSNLTLSGSGTKTLQTGTTAIGGNLTLSGTVTTTTVVGLTISGNLNIGDGTTFTAAAFALTVTGTTTIGAGASGVLTISSSTGTKAFNNDITINSGAIWNNTAGNAALTLPGNLSNNGTFNAGTGVYTFSGTSKTIGGTLTIPKVTVSGTCTNNGSLTVSTALAGSGTLDVNTGGTLITSGTSTVSITTLTIDGTYTNGSTGSITTTTLTVNGTYNHTCTTDNFPTASWASTSNCNITGFTGAVNCSNFPGQTYGNVTYNCTGQTGTIDLFAETSTTTIQGDFTVQSTGSSVLHMRLSGQIFVPTIVIDGCFNITGGTIDANNNGGTSGQGPIIDIYGCYNQTGGTFYSTTSQTGAICDIHFTGPSSSFSQTGGTFNTGSSRFPFTIDNGATLTLNSNLTLTTGWGFTVSVGSTLVIPLGITLDPTAGTFTTNGTLTVYGTIVGYNINTIAPGTYTDLIISGTGVYTTSGVTVNGILSIEGSATISPAVTFGPNATIQYNTTSTYTTGLEWPSSFAGTGGVIVKNTGVISVSANKTLTGGGLNINSGGTLDIQSNTITRSPSGGTLTVAGKLKLGANNFPTGFTTTTLTGGTVEYNGTAQTCLVTTYNNLTLSGSGVKTFATTPTINGILSLEGTASVTVTTGVVTYGSSATLQYNKPATYTATTEEWISPFVATGGVIIANLGTITTPGAITFNANAPLTINSGSTLALGANLLTLNGDLINNGGSTTSSGGVTIAGTAATQNIGSFTTTGTITLTKTSGISTFTGNVSGAALTINGSGGTLNLGAGLTHTFTGVVTLTAGTLDGGSSTLNENAVSTTAWTKTSGTFTASTSTINFGAAGNQTIVPATTFYNLNLTNSGTKTFGALMTINNKLTFSGTAIASLGGFASTTNTLTFITTDQTTGTWGGTGSGATHINTTYFAAVTGTVNVGASCATGTWLGTTSTDWGTSTNWCGNAVPTSSTNVIINSGGNQPTIGASAVCNNITINSGATLTISGSNTLTISGNWTNSGTFTSNSSTVTFSGTSQTLSGTNTFYNLTLSGSGTKTISSALTIGGNFSNSGVTLNAGSNSFTFNGTSTQSISGFTTTGNVSITNTSGVVTISGAVSATNLSVAGGASGSLVLQGSNTFNGTITLTSGTVKLNNSAALGIAGNSISLNGAILDLMSSTSVNAYNITLGAASTIISDLASTGAGITHTLGTLSIGNYKLSITVGSNVTSGTAGMTFGSTTLSAATPIFDVATGANLTLGALSGNFAFTKQNTGQLTLSTASARTSGTVTLTAGTLELDDVAALGTNAVPLQINGGTLNIALSTTVNAYNVTVGGSATIESNLAGNGIGITHTLGTLSIGNYQLNITEGPFVTSGTAGITFGATTLSAATPIFDIAANTNLTLGALTGNFSFTKQNSGQITLNSASTRSSGTTTLSSGIMSLGNASALGTTATTLNLNGGTLDLNINSSVNAYPVIIGGTVTIQSDLASSGVGIIHTLGTLSIGAQTLTIDGGDNVTSGTAGITFGAVTHTGAPTYNITNPSAGVTQLSLAAVSNSTFLTSFTGNGNVIQTGVFGNGSGGITYGGTGSLTLNQANTFTGGVTLNSGTLNINNASALGTIAGTFTITGGTINASSGAFTTINYPLALNGDFTFTGTNNLSLGTGTTTLNANRQITVSANKLTLGGTISSSSNSLTKAGSGNLSFGSNAVTLNDLTISAGTLTSTSGTLSLAGDFSNSGTFTHNSGTVVFNGTSTQTIGGTSATFNTLQINNASSITTLNVASTASAFTLTTGTFDASTYLLTATTPTLTAGILRVGSSTWAGNYSFTTTPAAGFTIEYYNTNPTINGAITYQNLLFSGSGTASANSGLIIQGNLTNTGGGSLNFGSNAVTLSGTVATNNIAGFTTTGNVSMTKTAGTATFNGSINAAALTINGSGGTLNLGTSLTHTFTGIVTLTAGTLNGGSSILNENATSASAWNGTGSNFTAGTSTIIFGGAAQTLATASTFYNLTFGNSGLKTLTGTPTVNNILSMEGTATASAAPTYGTAATLQYNTTSDITAGPEWITPFVATGGITNINSGTITLNASKTLTSGLTLTGGKVDIDAYTLTLNGNFSGSSANCLLGGASSNLTIGNSGSIGTLYIDQTTVGTTNRLQNLTINRSGQTITLGNTFEVTGTVTLSNGTLASAGFLTLVSNASGTARIAQITGTGAISGNVTVQRFIPGGNYYDRAYRFLASPASGQSIANSWQQDIHVTGPGTGGTLCPSMTQNSNGFDRNTGNTSSIFTFSESNGTWDAIANTTSTNLSSTTGYRVFVRGDRSQGCGLLTTSGGLYDTPIDVTVQATGTITTGTVNTTLTKTVGKGAGWNLVTNPYPSAIDWANATWIAAKSANINTTIYIWNPVYNTYATYNTAGGGTNGGSNIIQSGQAFWVRTTAGATLTFNEAYKSTDQTSQIFGKGALANNLKIQLKDTAVLDEAVVFTYTGATNNIENVDGQKLGFATGAIATYTNQNDTALTFNAIEPFASSAIDTIFIKAGLVASKSYTLSSIGASSFDNNVHPYLYDKYNATLTDLTTSGAYSFSTNTTAATYDPSRFYLIFANPSSLPVTLNNFTAQKTGNAVELKWNTSSEINSAAFVVQRSKDAVNFTDIANVKAAGNSNKNINYAISDNQPELSAINYYRLKQIDFNGKYYYSSIVAVDFNAVTNAEVKIWPNPVVDKMNIGYSGKPNELVTCDIYDLTGKKISSFNFISKPYTELSRDLSFLNNGVYFLKIKSLSSESTIKFVK